MSELLSLKAELYTHCQEYLQDKIRMLEAALASVTESRDNETKSSVGDKYETGRAMMQLEEEKYRTQLANNLQAQSLLDRIDPDLVRDKVEHGSLVQTDRGWYFLAIGIGKVKLQDKLFFVVSTDSPIGGMLLQKQVGDQIIFQGKKVSVLAIS